MAIEFRGRSVVPPSRRYHAHFLTCTYDDVLFHTPKIEIYKPQFHGEQITKEGMPVLEKTEKEQAIEHLVYFTTQYRYMHMRFAYG